jgi:serine/threonine protein kinase
MDAPPSPHPTGQALSSYGLGKLDGAAAKAVNEHLEECPVCRKRVAEMSADSFLERVREAQKPAGQSTPGQPRTGGTQTYKGANAPAPPPGSTLPPGLVDHPDYEIKRELGRGGMGVVYLAHNRLMGRDEVLKVMGRHIMERPGVLDRFLREIRAVARLRHPNIVSAYSAFRLGESLVFAMEYVQGLDLSKTVKAKGPLPVGHACNFVHQAALGLQHAHEEGLVHRDIKPHNLMLSRKGERPVVKVLDFGLAKVVREEKVDGGLTSEGQALGTPDFIAPEQILDAPSADIRADIYSLGGTLYYLLTARPPFQAKTLYDIYQAHISRDADPLNLIRPEVPAELAALVAKMMAKNPARRFQTPGEVAEALEPFFKSSDAGFKGPKPEMSQASPPSAGRRTATRTPEPNQSTANATRSADRLAMPAHTAPAESRWGSLIELREEEEASLPSLPRQPTGKPPRRKWPIALGASLFGLLALGVIVITIRDRSGRETGKVVLPEGSTATIEAPREKGTGDAGRVDAARSEPPPAESKPAYDVRSRTAELTSPPVVVPPERGGDSSASTRSPDVALETLSPVKAKTGWGTVYMNKNAAGGPIRLGGKTYARGVGVHADAELVYDLRPEYDRFVGRVGIDDGMKEESSIIVRVFADEQLLKESPVLNAGSAPWDAGVKLPRDAAGRGPGRLRLVVDAAGDGNEADMTDWVDVGFVVNPRPVREDRKAVTAGRIPNELVRPPVVEAVVALKGKAEIVSGRWLVEGRELVQIGRVDVQESKMFFGDRRWTDYDLTVDLMREKQNGGGSLSLLFRRTPPNDNSLLFHYWSTDGGKPGHWVLLAAVDGNERVHRDVGGFRLLDHEWYRARVSVRGNHYAGILYDGGGKEVIHLEADYDRLPSGQVGLSIDNSSYRFKNIKVTDPDGKTLWEMPSALGVETGTPSRPH